MVKVDQRHLSHGLLAHIIFNTFEYNFGMLNLRRNLIIFPKDDRQIFCMDDTLDRTPVLIKKKSQLFIFK